MNEKKLCSYRPSTKQRIITERCDDGQNHAVTYREVIFEPCLEEQCAVWRDGECKRVTK